MLLDPALLQLKEKFESAKIRKEGQVRATDRGYGFLETANRESYFIAPANMKKLLHGDKVVCTIDKDEDERGRAIPESLVETSLKRFVGRLTISNSADKKLKLSVIPDSSAIRTQIEVDDRRKDTSVVLKNGDFVICTLRTHALKQGEFRASLDEFVCEGSNPRAPWLVSLRGLNLPLDGPQTEDLSFNEDSSKYQDLTSLPFITIDSEKTEDMDDALYLEQTDDFFVLYVAIADPTAYIKEDSALDKEASERAFSIYLPGCNIPMLPRELSDNICSLREGEKRPALVGRLYIKKDGELLLDKTEFMPAEIISCGKLIYNEVSDFLEEIPNDAFHPNDDVAKVIRGLADFARVRDKYRSTHAAPFLPRPDYEFILNDDGALDHIEVNFRRIANQIVEEAMIAANLACGDLLAKTYGTGIFNIHKGFDSREKNLVLKLLKDEGYEDADENSIATMAGFCAVRRFAAALTSTYLDNKIRKLQEYTQISLKPGPHFALGVENYATWTSPIRKYGDMINHRLIKAAIMGLDAPKLPDESTIAAMNTARKINRQAERNVADWLYVDYLEPEIAKKTTFKGEVFDVVRGGLRVILTENGAAVFVPCALIAENKEALECSNTTGMLLVNGNCALRLGDPLEVRIVEINRTGRSIIAAPTAPIGGLMLPDFSKLKH